MRTKNIYIHVIIYKINLKNNIRTRELSQHVSAAYLKWDSNSFTLYKAPSLNLKII